MNSCQMNVIEISNKRVVKSCCLICSFFTASCLSWTKWFICGQRLGEESKWPWHDYWLWSSQWIWTWCGDHFSDGWSKYFWAQYGHEIYCIAYHCQNTRRTMGRKMFWKMRLTDENWNWKSMFLNVYIIVGSRSFSTWIKSEQQFIE